MRADRRNVLSHAEHLGPDTMLYVEVPEFGLLTVRASGDATEAVGDKVALKPAEGRVFRFGADGRTLA